MMDYSKSIELGIRPKDLEMGYPNEDITNLISDGSNEVVKEKFPDSFDEFVTALRNVFC